MYYVRSSGAEGAVRSVLILGRGDRPMKTECCGSCRWWKNGRCWNGHADDYTDKTAADYDCGEFWESREEVRADG